MVKFAPGGILLQPVGEGDGGAAAIRRDVAAQGGDLVGAVIGDQCNRSIARYRLAPP